MELLSGQYSWWCLLDFGGVNEKCNLCRVPKVGKVPFWQSTSTPRRWFLSEPADTIALFRVKLDGWWPWGGLPFSLVVGTLLESTTNVFFRMCRNHRGLGTYQDLGTGVREKSEFLRVWIACSTGRNISGRVRSKQLYLATLNWNSTAHNGLCDKILTLKTFKRVTAHPPRPRWLTYCRKV